MRREIKTEKYTAIVKAVRKAQEEPGLSLEEIAEALLEGMGVDVRYLVGPLKVILKKKYGKDN